MSNPPINALHDAPSVVSQPQSGSVQPTSDGVHDNFSCEGEAPTLHRVRAQAEIQAILQALQRTGWNRRRAARILDISYRGLLYKLRRHSITPTTNV
jgi:DNA-binding NtrC family response regulator